MKTTIKIMVILCLINTLNASNFKGLGECEKFSERQVEVNLQIDREYSKYKSNSQGSIYRLEADKKNLKQEIKYLKKKVDQETNWLIRIPFTKIGITVPFAQGFSVGFIVAIII